MNVKSEINKLNPIFWIFAFAIVFAIVYKMAALICRFPGTVAIIVVNICVMAMIWAKLISVEELTSSYVTVYTNRQFYRVLTAAFTHVLPIHILMNLVSLYNIGSVLEPSLSSNIFLSFYFLVLVLGGFISAFIHKMYLPNTPSLGASGALCGLLGIYISIIITIYGENQLGFIIPTIGILCLQVFWKRIDSIAHFSGLLTGIVIGVLYLKKLGY